MSILTIAALTVCLTQPQVASQTKTFTNYEFGLTFEYPSNWQLTTKKGDAKLTIPLEGGIVATVDIYSVVFNADTEIWRNVQRNIVLQMKRQLVEQQEEEILGVPMLTTRSRFDDKGTPTISLSGLVYSATPRKMLYRLTAPESVFGEAESRWRAVLQTVRTTSGKPLAPEDPNRKIDPKELKKPPEKPVKVTRIEGAKKSEGEIHKGDVAVPITVSNRAVVLRLPDGWEGEVTGDGEIAVKHPDLSEPIKVLVYFVLDSDPPARNLFKASSKSLDLFSDVNKREERAPAKNNGGAVTQVVWRWGKSSSGDLMTCEAVGTLGDFYWLFAYKSSNPGAGSDKKLIDSLISTMTVEPGT